MTVESKFNFKIDIKFIDSTIPEKELKSFKNWVATMPPMHGTGKFTDWYNSTDHDIKVEGFISIKN